MFVITAPLFCRWRSLFPALLLAFLTGCGGHIHHVVEPGETLYSIGFLYGHDYRQIAQWNGVRPPYDLNAGQVLRVTPPDGDTPLTKPAQKTTTKKSQAKTTARSADKSKTVVVVAPRSTKKQSAPSYPYSGKAPQWRWPVKNPRILRTFSANDPGRQGLAIAGRRGDPVYAAAAGKVVYAGSGLVRYGRLIIIKHNEKYLSAYAHNDKLRVKEGAVVKAGQRVADVGNTGTQSPMLHFEIRRNGKPVNPLRYLPKR